MQVQRARSNAPLFITNLCHYMGWVITATYRPLYPRESAPLPIVPEAGWKTRLNYRQEKRILNDDQQDANILAYLFIPDQLYMFRAMSSPIIRST